MSAPFVMITTHRVKPGRLAELAEATHDYNGFVEASEPRLRAHVAYLDDGEGEVSLVQVHADAASAENHMLVAGPHIGRGLELTETVAVEVYGEPGPIVRQALDANAAAGAAITVKSGSLGGFLRS